MGQTRAHLAKFRSNRGELQIADVFDSVFECRSGHEIQALVTRLQYFTVMRGDQNYCMSFGIGNTVRIPKLFNAS